MFPSLTRSLVSKAAPLYPIVSRNPALGTVIQRFSFDSKNVIDKTLSTAQEGFEKFSSLSIKERGDLLKNLANVLESRIDKLAELATVEMGKPIVESEAEVKKCAWVLRHFAETSEAFLKPVPVETDAQDSHIVYQPLGVVFGIFPWNFPFWQVYRAIAPSMMVGNVYIMRHAQNVPMCALAIEETFKLAGFPDGALQNSFCSIPTLHEMLEDPRVKATSLTGSVGAGASLAAKAGSVLKKAVLELGGSDPFIVLKDADLELAVDNAVAGRLLNSGQSCIAAKRFIVEKDILKPFTEAFVEKMGRVKIGNPMSRSVRVGPIARKDLMLGLHDQVLRSIEQGAKVLIGGTPMNRKGFFYPVTVLTDVNEENTAFTEELFGPVAPIIVAQDADDAVRLANKSDFGLGSSVFTKDIEKGKEIALRLEAGQAFVNNFVKSDPRLPFGGVKKSGYGRECSQHALFEFANVKTIWVK